MSQSVRGEALKKERKIMIRYYLYFFWMAVMLGGLALGSQYVGFNASRDLASEMEPVLRFVETEYHAPIVIPVEARIVDQEIPREFSGESFSSLPLVIEPVSSEENK